MKKLVLVILIALGLLFSPSLAQAEYSLAGTINFSNPSPSFLIHFEATLLPIDGFGTRISTELGIGNGFPTRTSVDLLYFSPLSLYFGAGFSLLTANSFNTFQYGVFATIGYDLLLYNSFSLYIETRPTYLLNQENSGQIIIPITFGFRLRYIAK